MSREIVGKVNKKISGSFLKNDSFSDFTVELKL